MSDAVCPAPVVGALAAYSPSIDSRSEVIKAQRLREHQEKLRPPTYAPSVELIEFMRSIARERFAASADQQKVRILRVLKRFPDGASVRDLQDHLEIGHAPRRIADLRVDGHLIVGSWVWQASAGGTMHRTVRYSLTHEAVT